MMTVAALWPREAKRKLLLGGLRTLVLNADMVPLGTFPLSVVPVQRAAKKLLARKTEMVDSWPDALIRTSIMRMEAPKVVALRRFVYIYGDPKFCRRSILLRDRFRCQYCGEPFPSPELTYDHVIPRSRGGRTEWANIVTACLACNARKANSLPNYSGRKAAGQMRPLKEPRRPTSAELLRAGLEFLPADMREDFGSWLYWSAELQA